MVNVKYCCDKCDKEIDHMNSKILIKQEDKYFTISRSINLCRKCYMEFMKTYLHQDIELNE